MTCDQLWLWWLPCSAGFTGIVVEDCVADLFLLSTHLFLKIVGGANLGSTNPTTFFWVSAKSCMIETKWVNDVNGLPLFGFPFLFCIIQKSFPKLKVSRNPFISLGPFDSAGSRWSVWVASSMNGSFPRRRGRSWDPAEIPLAPWWKRVTTGENGYRGSLDISVVSLVMSQGRNWRLPAPTQPQMLWVFWLQLKELEAISPRVGIEPRNGYITHSSWRRLMTHDLMTRRTKNINIPSHYSGKGRPQMISLFACRGVLEPCWQTATLRLSGSCWRHLTLWN